MKQSNGLRDIIRTNIYGSMGTKDIDRFEQQIREHFIGLLDGMKMTRARVGTNDYGKGYIEGCNYAVDEMKSKIKGG